MYKTVYIFSLVNCREDNISIVSSANSLDGALGDKPDTSPPPLGGAAGDHIYGNSPQSKFVKVDELEQYVGNLQQNIRAAEEEFKVRTRNH